METANITIRLDRTIRNEAEALFKDLGLSLSTAFNMFLRQSIREQGLPFAVSRAMPNAQTRKAMKEAEALAHDSNAKTYSTVEELFKDAEA